MQTKYIFVTGGVVSGLGKGIAAASLGRLLKQRGLRVKVQKLDPYLNVDPGTMSPYQHGEVFVTDDGAETDLDLGHYERFIDENLTGASSVSSGKIYWNVLNRERAGDYLGGHRPDHPPHHRGDQGTTSTPWRARTPTWPLWRSAALWATLRASPSWSPSARWPPSGADRTSWFIHVSLIVSIPGSGGAEEQAHPALGEGAAGPGDSTRCNLVPQ